MNKYIKRLIIVFILLILIKVVLSCFILTPTQFSDEYWYQRMAQSFFRQGEFLIDEKPSTYYPPLYSVLISPAFVFSNMKIVFFFMKFINCILSSTILFAGFLLAKEFMNRKKAFKVSVLISVVPPMFGFFPFVLSENLFYPLFLLTIYFMYKSFIEKNYWWVIFAGLFIGLCSLTKFIGLFLIPAYGLTLLIKFIKNKGFFDFIKKSLLSSVIFFLIYGWWMLRNFILFGNVFGKYNELISNIAIKLSSTNILKSVFILLVSNIGILILGSLIIFFIYALLSYKKGKYSWFYILSWITIICYLLFVSIYNYKTVGDGRLIERYFAQLIPLLIIMGFYGFRKHINNKFWIPCLSVLFLISGFKFISEKLIPVNNMSLSYIGVLNIIFDFIYSNYLLIIFLILLPFSLLILRKFKLKTLFTCMLVFFVLINFLNFGISYYNSQYKWYNQEPMQMGLWFNSYNNDKNVVIAFDNRDQLEIKREKYGDKYSDYTIIIKRPINVAAFWINSKVIRFYDVSDLKSIDYVFTPLEMDLELIKKSEKIYIYKTD